jgi:hypothetical protein
VPDGAAAQRLRPPARRAARIRAKSLLASAALILALAPASSTLPFIEDDYGRALAEARAKKLPLFIEAWAPW